MKKLMVAIGGAAAALGLFAATSGIPNGNSFEAFNDNQSLSLEDLTVEEGSRDMDASWSGPSDAVLTSVRWTAAEKEGCTWSRIAQFDGKGQNHYLTVKTPLTSGVARTINNGGVDFGTEGLYVDTLVKFTVADEEIEFSDSEAKIAVWAMETTDAAGEVTGANLMAKAGKYVGGTRQGATVYDLGALANPTNWHRLTIKAVNGGGAMGFVVYVDENVRNCTAAQTAFDGVTLNGIARVFCDAGQLLPSLLDFSSLAAIAVAGQGAIDDISFTQTAPEFAKDYQFYTIDWSGVQANISAVATNGVALTAAEFAKGSILVIGLPGEITLSWTGNGNFMDGSKSIDPASGETVMITSDDVKPAKALFETTKYESLAEAVKEANKGSGGTIKLLDHATKNITFAEGGDIILDLAGYNIDASAGTGAAISAGLRNLIITNSETTIGKVIANTTTNPKKKAVAAGDGDVWIYGGIFDGEVITKASIFDGQFRVAENGTETCALTAPDGKKFVKGGEGNAYWVIVDAPTTATLTIPALSYVMVSATTGTPAVVIAEAAGAYTVDIGAEVAVTWTATGNYFFGNNTQTTNETVTVGAEGATLVEPATQEGKAKKGTTFFLTLQDALNDSAAETITLLANGSIGGASKAETIDLNGFTLDIVAPTVDYDFKVIDTKETGKFTYDTGSSLTVNGAVLDLSGINFSQTAGCTGGFVLNNEDATVKLPAGAGAYPAWTAAIVSAVQGAKVVDAGVTYTKYADGWSTVAKAVARVGEDDRLYATIEGAVAGAEADETITLLANCAIAKTTATFALSINKNLTLDARNYTLTGPSGQYGIIVENGATFTFVSGTITPEKDTSNSILSVGYEEDDKWTKSAGYLVVNGGTIRGNGKSGNAIAAQAGTVTITSGSIVNVGARAVKAECSATAVINGGTIGDLNMTKPACYCAGNGAITINGGVINGNCNAGVTIPGTSTATFDRDQSAFCAVGYLTKLNTAEPARYEVVEAVAVTGVELSESAVTLAPEAQETLVATIAPVNADVKSTTWKTSDAGVATVANGVVTAVAAGSATITVEVVDYCGNTKTATCAVTVKSAEPEPVVPGEPVVVTDPVAATNAFNTADDATKAKYVKAPNVGDKLDATQKAAYAHYFKAVPNGGNAIMFVFDEAKSAELKTTVDAQLGKVDITGTSETEIDAVAGFFYRFVGGTEVGTITTGGTAAQAGVSGKVSLTKPDLGATTKAFYKVEVRAYTWVK